MALNPSNSNSLEQLALKGLKPRSHLPTRDSTQLARWMTTATDASWVVLNWIGRCDHGLKQIQSSVRNRKNNESMKSVCCFRKKCISSKEICIKSISNVLPWFHRCFVWLVPNDHKWPYCITRVCCKTDYLGLFPEHGLCLGQASLHDVCACSYFLFITCVFDVCCIIVFYFIDLIFDSASGHTIKTDWLVSPLDRYNGRNLWKS